MDQSQIKFSSELIPWSELVSGLRSPMDPVVVQKFRGNKKSNNSGTGKQLFQDKFFTYTFIAFGCCSPFSRDTNMYYEEYVEGSLGTPELKKEKKMKDVEEKVKKGCLGDVQELVLPSEELKRRADDFIARVNRQRMSEDRLVL
ncbi:hypothetical protein HRI_001240300 [Hibiscus trionum]|uniref:Uncharacterized protein n=1 Tax=Hibiscus trionum TaxID=183268 RepID=A0A9W7LUI0_HIBTR|nr:hypothetical protein HRI_001240300 [Hibiscus trionum]